MVKSNGFVQIVPNNTNENYNVAIDAFRLKISSIIYHDEYWISDVALQMHLLSKRYYWGEM